MLKLHENLRKLRLNWELTQEQFASILGVSAQAVSRWENGATYPDITMLPAIAAYFEVTLDELMGMEDFKNGERIKELLTRIDENASKGALYENILLLRETLKTHPTNYELQLKLIGHLRFCAFKDGHPLSDGEQKSLSREAIELGNRILSRCTDSAITNRTIQHLCYIYLGLGEREKAIEYAKKLPDIGACSTVILGDLYEGEQQKSHLKLAVKACTSALWCNLRNMADLECRDKCLSDAERITILQKALAFLEFVFENGDYLDYSSAVSGIHNNIASLAIQAGDYALALSSLEKAAEFAIMADTLPAKAQHTSLLVNRLEWDALTRLKNFDFSECQILYKEMQQEKYNVIRNDERFIVTLENLKKYC